MRACQILVSVRFSSSRKLPRADSLRPVKPTLLMAWLLEGGGCRRRRRRHAIGDTNKSTLDGLRTHRRGGCAGGEFPLKLLLRNKSHQNYYVCIIFERDRQRVPPSPTAAGTHPKRPTIAYWQTQSEGVWCAQRRKFLWHITIIKASLRDIKTSSTTSIVRVE